MELRNFEIDLDGPPEASNSQYQEYLNLAYKIFKEQNEKIAFVNLPSKVECFDIAGNCLGVFNDDKALKSVAYGEFINILFDYIVSINNYKKDKKFKMERPWIDFDNDYVRYISFDYISNIDFKKFGVLFSYDSPYLDSDLKYILKAEEALNFSFDNQDPLKSNNLSKRLSIDGLNNVIMDLTSINKLESKINMKGVKEIISDKTKILILNEVKKYTPTAQRLFLYCLTQSMTEGRIIKFKFEEYLRLLNIKDMANSRKAKNSIIEDLSILENINVSFPYNISGKVDRLSGNLIKTNFYYKNALKNEKYNGKYQKGEQIAFVEIFLGAWAENIELLTNYYVISNNSLYKIDLNKYRYAMNLVILFDSQYRINSTNSKRIDKNNRLTLKMDTVLNKCGITKSEIKKRGELYYRDKIKKHFNELVEKNIFNINYDTETDVIKIKPVNDFIIEKYRKINTSCKSIKKRNSIRKSKAIQKSIENKTQKA